jgi:MoxR-like ATPase
METEKNCNGTEMNCTFTIDDTTIYLRQPDAVDSIWIGQKEAFRLLSAAWLKRNENDKIMTPLLVGPPGCGKTTLACAVAQEFELPVYLINCTSDMRPEDLLITPVLSSDRQIVYRASSLVSAMVNGGICILDEANRMNEKSWASLASLLDDRRYIESIIAGIKIRAHPEFRLVATINDDASTFNLPEYIESRLKPVLSVEFPEKRDLFRILEYHVPFATKSLIEAIIRYLEEKKKEKSISGYSIRDALQITRFAHKFPEDDTVTVDFIAPKVLNIRESPAHTDFIVLEEFR